MTRSIDRRALLRSALAASGGAVALGTLAPSAPAAPAPALDVLSRTKGPAFFADESLNFQTLFALGGAGYGVSEFGEVVATIARVQAAGNTYRAFAEQFQAMAKLLGERADAARKAGHRVTERDCSLRAANYHNQALFFALALPGKGQEARLYRQMRSRYDRAMRLLDPPAEPVRIPYEGSAMPGWLLRPPGRRRRRPTVIFNNGSDAQNVDQYAWGAAAAVQRGYNALIFEGPGQGSMLFLRHIPFRPDWEKVVTPVVDFLRARDDVDRRRIALWGWSFGGYLVERAAAFEHRLAALVADPGVVNYVDSWPKAVIATGYDGTKREVDASWRNFLAHSDADLRVLLLKRLEIFQLSSWYEAVREMAKYRVTPALLRRITAPTLLTSPQLEQFYPGQSEVVYAALRAPKALHRFTARDGSQWHCEPMAPQHRNEVILDWLGAAGRLG
jgi:cephalosporin-C deacetylase-like acetyl esterase